MMTLHDKLLLGSSIYCALVGKPMSAISLQFLNDGKKLTAIAAGSSLTCLRYEQAMRDFAKSWPDPLSWPDGVEWPTDVPRPSKVESKTKAF